MDQSDIIALPHADLRKRSKRVGVIDENIRKLSEDMKSATLSWEDSRQHEVGVALAAVQVDELLRLVIIRNNFEDKSDRNFRVFINPEIVKREGEVVEDFEGCLSIKDIYGKVPRHEKVKVKALDIDGQEIRVTAEGYLARIFQHEIDHTKGVVFIDHIKDDPDAFFKLKDDGSLEKLDYAKQVKDNHLLW
jgi:peptide deformylase